MWRILALIMTVHVRNKETQPTLVFLRYPAPLAQIRAHDGEPTGARPLGAPPHPDGLLV
jgi:hypothetical protein